MKPVPVKTGSRNPAFSTRYDFMDPGEGEWKHPEPSIYSSFLSEIRWDQFTILA